MLLAVCLWHVKETAVERLSSGGGAFNFDSGSDTACLWTPLCGWDYHTAPIVPQTVGAAEVPAALYFHRTAVNVPFIRWPRR